MEFIEKVKLAFGDSDKLFNAVKGEDLGGPLRYYLMLLIVPTAILIVLSGFAFSFLTAMMWYIPEAEMLPVQMLQMFGPVIGLAIGGVFYVSAMVGSIISAAILHVILFLFGAKKGFENTYKAIAYGGTPSVLFSWIPLVNIIFSIWSWYLVVKGFSKLHGITMGQAFLATLIPVIVVAAFAVFGMMAYMASMFLV